MKHSQSRSRCLGRTRLWAWAGLVVEFIRRPIATLDIVLDRHRVEKAILLAHGIAFALGALLTIGRALRLVASAADGLVGLVRLLRITGDATGRTIVVALLRLLNETVAVRMLQSGSKSPQRRQQCRKKHQKTHD